MLIEVINEVGNADALTFERKIAALLARGARMEDAEVRAVLRMLSELRASLAVQLLAIPTAEKGLWKAQQLGQLRAAIDRVAASFASRYGSALTGAVNKAWDRGDDFVRDSLSGARVTVTFAQELSRTQLEVVSQLHADLVRAVSDDFRLKAGREITMGVAGEKTPFQIMQSVGNLLRTQPLRGEMGPIANQAERIVRTEMNQAFSIASRVRGNEIARDVPGMLHYWRSARDGRVRDTHATADSRYRPGGSPGPIPWDKPFSVGGASMRYPHDPAGGGANNISCRCVDIQYKREWFK